MHRSILVLLVASSLACAQTVPSDQSQETNPPAQTEPAGRKPDRPNKTERDERRTKPGKVSRPRRVLGLVGLALVGTGAALVLTAGRTREVPASNCSFYPAPFVPCVPAHTEKVRSGVQERIGGGAVVGGFVLIYTWMGSH